MLLYQAGKVVPKRKLWNADQVKGSKRLKAEVAVRSADSENDIIPEGVSQEAYELMIKGKVCVCVCVCVYEGVKDIRDTGTFLIFY